MKKADKLRNHFKTSGLFESEKIELDNLDWAKLIYNESNEVVVENEHGTEFSVDDLSDEEIDIFMGNIKIRIPDDLVNDMIITIGLFADMFNCNEESLATHGIDWWYLHKLNRRVKKYRR